jgi:uncharacterized protein (DUF1330 family)
MTAKGYIVVTYRKITDQEKWAAYAKLAAPAIQKAGGRFIVRGNPAKTYELGMKERVVIVEFDNVHKALAAHETPDYQTALKALGDGAERDFRIVEGAH